jgi:hypothetical protein
MQKYSAVNLKRRDTPTAKVNTKTLIPRRSASGGKWGEVFNYPCLILPAIRLAIRLAVP